MNASKINPVELLIRYSGLTQKEFAKKVDVLPSQLSGYKTGKFSISAERLFEWCEIIGLDDYNLFKS